MDVVKRKHDDQTSLTRLIAKESDAMHVIRRAKTGHSSAPKTGHRVGGIEQKNRLIRFCWQGA